MFLEDQPQQINIKLTIPKGKNKMIVMCSLFCTQATTKAWQPDQNSKVLFAEALVLIICYTLQ
jgi:hypothetical protein